MSTSSPVSRDATVSADGLVAWLVERLQETRRRVLQTRTFVGACCVALSVITGIALLAAVDYFAELPFGVRAVAFCSLMAAVAACGYLFYRRWIGPLTLSKAASETEKRTVSFGQRLRTTLDYRQPESAPAKASPELLSAMHRQTDQLARQVDWDAIVDARPAIGACAAAAVALVAWCAAIVAMPEYRTASARAMLLPAEYTHVDYTPHEQTVRYGDSIQIEVTISGRPLRSGKVRHREVGSSDDAWNTVELGEPAKTGQTEQPSSVASPAALQGAFAVGIENLQHDLEFEVLAGPRPLPPGRITVLQPLSIEQVATHVVPPEYTGRPDETGDSLELRVLEGSDVELRLELNRPAAAATLEPDRPPLDEKVAGDEGPPKAVPMVISDKSLAVTLRDLRKSASFSIQAKAADGMSLEPARVRIRVALDQKPQIKFLSPPEELVVISTAEVPIVAEASDDLGLYKVGIQYRLDEGELQTLWEGSGDGSTDPLRAASLLLLEDLHVTFRNSISYYAYAEDNYFGQARRTTSELRFVDIRPFKIEYQLSDSPGGCCCSVSLEELINSQRANLAAAFAERQQSRPSAENAEKLRRGEAGLHSQTQDFAAGIEARSGPVPALDEAVFAMQQAVERLSRQAIDEAVEHEQQALARLLEARENLRQILENSRSQASNCRKFDRDFRQKLRRPEKKDSDKEQLAQARKKLEELTERERKWGQQAQQRCNSSGSSAGRSQQAEAQPPAEQPPQESGPPKSGEVPSAQELAAAQDQLRQELDALKQELAGLNEAGKAAPQQAERADEAMQRGREELDASHGAAASEAADQAAERLEELADHLATVGSQDFGQRLDEARRRAEQIAARQDGLARRLADAAKPDGQLGREENSLATRVEMLAELVEELRRDSAAETASTRRRLDAAANGTPPGEIAKGMNEAASAVQAGRLPQAVREAEDARSQMNELTRALAAARAEFAQPQLEELMALEEQLARLMEQAQRAEQPAAAGKAELKRKWEAIAEKVARLAESDPRLARALDHAQARPNAGGAMPQGHFSWIDRADFQGPREVAKALQAKIQEAILAGSLTDSDQPVPPEYKPLVDKYYKTLSDDLR